MGKMVIAPAFVLAMIFQKQIVEGLIAGALKG
jgi:ABC-type glycerol-3-phosphate transport system permease component